MIIINVMIVIIMNIFIFQQINVKKEKYFIVPIQILMMILQTIMMIIQEIYMIILKEKNLEMMNVKEIQEIQKIIK